MGFFDKHNPRATPRSLTAWAVAGGITGGVFGFLGWLRTELPFWTVFVFVPWMVVWCGFGCWAMEWQESAED
jgi:hypothetical protein